VRGAWVCFSALSFGLGFDVHIRVAFSFMYHIMLASLYHRLHLYHMLYRCASLIYLDNHDMLDMRL
jgi:hypothetical protein